MKNWVREKLIIKVLKNWKDEKLQKWEIGGIIIEKIAKMSSIIK